MTYSLKKVLALEKEINANLPLFAYPSPRLIKQCKDSGVRIKKDRLLQIDKVTYIKEEQDIFCMFYVDEASKSVLTSIVNLVFNGEGSLIEKIKKFQI
ncbi:MAG: hypothetical protein ACMUJM_24930 [bacterium]